MMQLSPLPSHRFRTSDGITIAYRWWGPQAGPVAVLQHGFASDSLEEWHTPGVVHALVEAGRRVLTIDARGHGASDAPHTVSSYGEPRMAADLVELVDEIAGGEPFDLVGYSMGSIVSLLATVTLRDRVRRLVVGGVGSGVVEVGGVDSRALDSVALVEAFGTLDPSTIQDPGLAAWRSASDSSGADHLALSAVAGAVYSGGIPLATIAVPTLIIAGADDFLADRPGILAAAIPAATLEVVTGGHGDARHDPRFAAAIVEFLTR